MMSLTLEFKKQNQINNKKKNSTQILKTDWWLPEKGCGGRVKWVKMAKRYKLPVIK